MVGKFNNIVAALVRRRGVKKEGAAHVGNAARTGNRKVKSVGLSSGNLLRTFVFMAVALILAAGFTLAHDWTMQTGRLPINKITVTGAFHLTPDQVIRQAGIVPGANIFEFNLKIARKRLLSNPWIADARVRRDLPHEIHISVKEHRPLAVFDLDDKYLLSDKGVLFKHALQEDTARYPLLQGLDISDIPLMNAPKSPGFKAALAVLELGESKDAILPVFRINRIRVDSEMGVTVFAFRPETGIFLGYDDFETKYRRLSRVFDYLKQKNPDTKAAMIDVSDPQRVVVSWHSSS